MLLVVSTHIELRRHNFVSLTKAEFTCLVVFYVRCVVLKKYTFGELFRSGRSNVVRSVLLWTIIIFIRSANTKPLSDSIVFSNDTPEFVVIYQILIA